MRTPAKRAARGAEPVRRIWNPVRWRVSRTCAATTAAIAATTPQCAPVPAISSGFAEASQRARLREPGKPDASGLRSQETAAEARRLSAT